MICHKVVVFFSQHFSVMEHNRLTKVTLVSFPQKPSFKAIVQFGPKAAKIMHPYVPGNYISLFTF